MWAGTLLTVPGRPNTILAGSSYVVTQTSPYGMQRSQDGGQTWSSALSGLPHHDTVDPYKIAASATGTLILGYGCSSDGYNTGDPRCPRGLARSIDGGRTWQLVGPPAAAATRTMVLVLHDNSFVAILAPVTHGNPVYHTYVSRDDGQAWRLVGGPFKEGPALALLAEIPWKPYNVLAGEGLNYPVTIEASSNAGTHWLMLWESRNSNAHVAEAFAAVPRAHTLLLATDNDIYRSTDDGARWRKNDSGLPANGLRQALLVGADGRTIYLGTTGAGVYRSTDDGQSWQPAS
jgi:photosystem II stability/assembly factor-like uncharacterized protein